MRKRQISYYIFMISLIAIPILNIAQPRTDELIEEIQDLMVKHYIFLDKAQETNAHLEELMKENYFDTYTAPEELAQVITEQLQKVTHDKHLSVYSPKQPKEAVDPITSFASNLRRYREPMVNGFTYFENNVGYVDLRYFGGNPEHFAEVDVMMQQLEQADALIIDLRQNSGGSTSMVQYLCSYFFDEDKLLSSIYSRVNHALQLNDHTRELWTVEVKGKKRPNLPVFILTSGTTFSAAEDFSYTLQTHGKARTIGEVTRGGAHPIDYFPLVDGFRIKIPFARSINSITQSNWEGVGVTPDVKVKADKALEKAKEMALMAATKYKNSFLYPLKTSLNALENKITQQEEDRVFKILKEGVKADMFTESEINALGYQYLSLSRTNAALAIFKSNILLFPYSANVYNSYAEALSSDGQNELALKNYKKAVELAREQNHKYLEAFQYNLKSFEERDE